MITFGNEELLADGREDLPRIIDIARPTRLIIESTQKPCRQKHFCLLHLQIIVQASLKSNPDTYKWTGTCCRELAISTVTAVNQGANNVEGDNGAHVHIAVRP